jgi:hypothetical protein
LGKCDYFLQHTKSAIYLCNFLHLGLLSLIASKNFIDIKLENEDKVTSKHEISVPLNARRFFLHGKDIQHKKGMFVTGER